MSESPIDRTIGFQLGGVEATEIAFTTPLGAGLYSYARRENPTVSDCEQALAEIEEANWCVLTPSGMAAVNIALSIFNDPEDHRPWIFPADVYSGTKQYASDVLRSQRGVNSKFTDPGGKNSTTSKLLSAIEDEPPTLVFIEPARCVAAGVPFSLQQQHLRFAASSQLVGGRGASQTGSNDHEIKALHGARSS